MTDKTDLQLIELCLKGQKHAFEELLNRYKNLVYSIIMRKTGDPEEANDLAQDVFLKAYKNLASYSPEFKFSTWIMRITNNHIIDFYRKKRQETLPLEAAESVTVAPEEYPEAVILRREEADALAALVAELPAIYKMPIILYHQNGLSYQEIADSLDEPLSKIKNRIFRGRRLLKEGCHGLR